MRDSEIKREFARIWARINELENELIKPEIANAGDVNLKNTELVNKEIKKDDDSPKISVQKIEQDKEVKKKNE